MKCKKKAAAKVMDEQAASKEPRLDVLVAKIEACVAELTLEPPERFRTHRAAAHRFHRLTAQARSTWQRRRRALHEPQIESITAAEHDIPFFMHRRAHGWRTPEQGEIEGWHRTGLDAVCRKFRSSRAPAFAVGILQAACEKGPCSDHPRCRALVRRAERRRPFFSSIPWSTPMVMPRGGCARLHAPHAASHLVKARLRCCSSTSPESHGVDASVKSDPHSG